MQTVTDSQKRNRQKGWRDMAEPVLQVENLKFVFNKGKRDKITAIDDVSFKIDAGSTLCVVGESGCGKSVTATSILQLMPKSLGYIEKGSIKLCGRELTTLGNKEMRQIRGNQISMIFQEPMSSLNPVYKIGDQMIELIRSHRKMSKDQARQIAVSMLAKVGISSPELRVNEYPHQLSGGMRQRVMIAMALSCNPQLLIADEPTTALDVTIQAQILQIINDLKKELNTAVMLITHDMGVIAEMADYVAVMYAGSIVERAPVKKLFDEPLHPYTEGLLNSIPTMEDSKKELETIEGNVPSLYNLPEGCAFCNRCKYAKDICRHQKPPRLDLDDRMVSCFRYTDQWKED